MQLEEFWNRRCGRRTKLVDYFANPPGDRVGASYAFPRGVDVVEQAVSHGRASQQFEIFLSRAPPGRTAHALALVHAKTCCRDLGERFSQERTEPSRFQNR